jgi:hypothetical protein
MGITVTCGRTSLLKRFLSMPRYLGASRSRMKRGRNSACEGCREGINDPAEVCGSGRLGMSCHSIPILLNAGTKVSPTNRGKFGRNRTTVRPTCCCASRECDVSPVEWAELALTDSTQCKRGSWLTMVDEFRRNSGILGAALLRRAFRRNRQRHQRNAINTGTVVPRASNRWSGRVGSEVPSPTCRSHGAQLHR